MAEPIDRRKFLTYTGAAGAATGALWVAPSVLGSSSAFAAGSCNLQDQIDWASFTDGAFNRQNGGTFSVTPDRIVGTGTPGYQVNVTVTAVGSVAARDAFTSVGHAFGNLPAAYILQMQGSGSSTNYGYDITFTWPTGFHAYTLNYSIADVDEGPASSGNPPPDWVDDVYTDVPFNGNDPGATLNTNRIAGQGTSTSPWHGINGPKSDTSNLGNILIGYASSTEISSLTVSYRGDNTRQGAIQSVGVGNLTWCL